MLSLTKNFVIGFVNRKKTLHYHLTIHDQLTAVEGRGKHDKQKSNFASWLQHATCDHHQKVPDDNLNQWQEINWYFG